MSTAMTPAISHPVPAAERARHAAAWLLAGWIAWELLFYEQYKLTGHPGSVQLFTTITDWLGVHGYEKWMRLGTGICEIIASVLVLLPATRVAGAYGALMLMSGAIFFHVVSPLGIDPYNDGAKLFTEACVTWIAAVAILALFRREAVGIARSWLKGRPRLTVA